MLAQTVAQASVSVCNPFTSVLCLAKTAEGALPGVGAAQQAANGAVPAVKAAAGAVGDTAISALASSMQTALAQIATGSVSLWTKIPSPDLNTDPIPGILQQWLWPFTAGVAMIGIITQAIRMTLTRKSAPLAEVGAGILTMAAVSALATALPALLLQAGDSFSTFVLNSSTGGQFSQRFTELISLGQGAASPVAPGLVIVLGIIAIIMSAVQAVLLIFRLGSVVLLTGMLPLAAAGRMTSLTKGWLPKLAGWLLALICWKPFAALAYATGFAMFGSGTTLLDVLMGFAIMLLSLIALPAILRFFSWTTGGLESGGGGGLLGAVIGGASAVGAMRGYGMTAPGMASALSGALGNPGGGPGQGGTPGAATPPGARPGGGAGGTAPQGSGPGFGGSPAGTAGAGPGTASAGPGTASAGPGSAGAGGRQAAGAGGGPAPGGAASAPGGAGTAASGAAGGSAAAGAAAGAPAGPAGMVVLGAASALKNAADGAVPAPEQRS